MRYVQIRFVVLILLAVCLCQLLHAEALNMVGRQSQNEGISVVPAPGKVTIDGDVREWDWSGRIWVFADSAVRTRFSVELAAMWDADHLYLAEHWKDPTPMFNAINPAFNPEEGWKSDACQFRIQTDRIIHLTTWYYTLKKQPVMHICETTSGVGGTALTQEDGSMPARGVELAYRKDEDGKGYVQELKVPWSLLYKQVPEIKAGLIFRLGGEFLWGDPTGKSWPMHRYADNMQPGVTSREFYWTNTKAWGNAELVANGNISQRQYRSEEGRLAGSIPVRVKIPKRAVSFTVAINDAKGKRIRNLAGAFTPEDYTVAVSGNQRTVEVLWDGLDDQGKLVAPGKYSVIGLTHDGLGADYDMCFYNPGTPSWATVDGTGAWGADHCPPQGVTTAGDWTFITWPNVEGGNGLIGIGPDGLKKWGEKRGVTVVAADEAYVYAYTNSWYQSGALCRFEKTTGANRPFLLDGAARPFELSMKQIFGEDIPGGITAMTVTESGLALALGNGTLALLNPATAVPISTVKVGAISALAAHANTLYALCDGHVYALNPKTGARTEMAMPGLVKPVGLAVDPAGNILVADLSPDCQVKAFTPAGTLAYTAGVKGGRPDRGTFNPQAMSHMSAVAVDARGQIWVVESWEYPRRVSVWGKDGKLIRDYIGNTGYAGTDCFLHDVDPTLAYAGPVEMKLDRAQNRWTVTRVLWVPNPAAGEYFDASPHSGGDWGQSGIRTSAASGKTRSYLFSYKGPQVVFMPRGDAWQPVAAIFNVEQVSGKYQNGKEIEPPSGPFTGLKRTDGIFWNDTNKDGKVTRDECVVVSGGLKVGASWAGHLGDDLSIYCSGIVRYRPIGFTGDGAPIYGPTGMKDLGTNLHGSLAPVPDEHLLLCLSYDNYPAATPGLVGLDNDTGAIRWTYPNPYPGVHGSHRATMPKPGLMIGAMKICGVAKVNKQAGSICLVRGNLGQDFLFTTDGLYVGALFQDGRLPGDALPAKESALKGMPMEGFTEGGEPFNGWFGKQADGKIRLTTGMAREAAMILEITGLDSVRPFRGGTLTLDVATLARAERDNAVRLAAASAPKRHTIVAITKAVTLDGKPTEWAAVPAMRIEREGSPNRGTLKLAYDRTNLYALFEVEDPSPWRNEGKDFTRLFKTGDAVDLQLATDPKQAGKRGQVVAGDLRLVFSQFNGTPVAVLMKPIDPTATPDVRVKHSSPVGNHTFDRLQVLTEARVAVDLAGGRYTVEAAVPLAAIGLAPQPGLMIRGDAGIISSDAAGLVNMARTYWSNQATNLVNDLPSEAWLYPDTWGELLFE